MPSSLAVIMSTTTEIISSSVDNNRAANNGVLTSQFELGIVEVESSFARFISFDVTQITNMTVLRSQGIVVRKNKN
eukprot:CAMPEP_0201506308 /NCGR_PEP_ID=MMETSP0161_2-20130828/237_1 /ASSEMBLY_ACC=CAM_ASM_000251 /TAXON_ID=180227 /ORGANISM="Neoparamoeba aestuarina, Strain SoJaBio B1-5/56/2" /LENGTH=75 /DNA_ID=CAMNT_0047900361 /DNA_START=129 /DNA_END=356 /DNA_ORIENTATION=+